MDKGKTQKLHLKVETRDVFGKKLKKLRHQSLIPANIFGPGFKSTAISAPVKDFNKIYKVAGETGVIFLNLGKEEIPVLIKHTQRHPISHSIIHIDLRKIDLKQKIETEVPIKTANESPAVNQKGGVLLTQADHVLVEALPEEIPHEIEVDLSKLVEIGDEIKVKDLTASGLYTVKEDAEKVIVSVIAHKEESVTPETTAVAPEITTEKEGEEVAPAEGETPTEAPAEGKESAKVPASEEKTDKPSKKPARPAGGPPKDEKKKE